MLAQRLLSVLAAALALHRLLASGGQELRHGSAQGLASRHAGCIELGDGLPLEAAALLPAEHVPALDALILAIQDEVEGPEGHHTGVAR